MGCALEALMWIVTIGVAVGSGILAWNWIEPHNFWGVIAFLIVWGIAGKIGYFIAMAIISGIASLFD